MFARTRLIAFRFNIPVIGGESRLESSKDGVRGTVNLGDLEYSMLRIFARRHMRVPGKGGTVEGGPRPRALRILEKATSAFRDALSPTA